MKAGWEKAKLSDLCRIELGKTPARKDASLWDDIKTTDNVWLTIGDMPRSIHSHPSDSKEYVSNKAKPLMKVVPKGTLLLSFKLTIGRVVFAGRDLYTNEAIAALHELSSKITKEYLYWALVGFDWEAATAGEDKIKGKTLNKAKLKKLLIPIPPLEEQRQIVAVLDEAFAALDCARENVKASLDDAKELFVRQREVFLSNLENGTRTSFEEVLQIESGQVDPKVEPFASQIHIGAGNMLSNTGDLVDLKTAKEEGLKSGKYKFDTEAVLYSKIRPYLKKACAPDFDGICSADVYPLRPDTSKLTRGYLLHLLLSEDFTVYAIEGSARAGMPKVNRKHLMAYQVTLPILERQFSVVKRLAELGDIVAMLEASYVKTLSDTDKLRQSLLQRAFAGELTQSASTLPVNDNDCDEQMSTATLVFAFDKHLVEQRQSTFGHVKAQKTLHLTESIVGLDLGRQPQVRQAGPHDQEHFARVEAWAKQNGIFEFKQRRSGGYTFTRGTNYDAFLSEAKTLLADYELGLSRFLPLLVDMNTEEAEVFTTVHAAWNNLLADGKTPSADDIVTAARENWHESKMEINRQKFFEAITKIRRHDLEPDGTAKYVSGVQESLI